MAVPIRRCFRQIYVIIGTWPLFSARLDEILFSHLAHGAFGCTLYGNLKILIKHRRELLLVV